MSIVYDSANHLCVSVDGRLLAKEGRRMTEAYDRAEDPVTVLGWNPNRPKRYLALVTSPLIYFLTWLTLYTHACLSVLQSGIINSYCIFRFVETD